MIKFIKQWLYNRDFKRGYAEARKDVEQEGFDWATTVMLMSELEYTKGEIDGYMDYLKKFHNKFIAR